MSGWSRGPARLDRDSGRPRTRTGEELPPAVTARMLEEFAARERLKEELVRQYEQEQQHIPRLAELPDLSRPPPPVPPQLHPSLPHTRPLLPSLIPAPAHQTVARVLAWNTVDPTYPNGSNNSRKRSWSRSRSRSRRRSRSRSRSRISARRRRKSQSYRNRSRSRSRIERSSARSSGEGRFKSRSRSPRRRRESSGWRPRSSFPSSPANRRRSRHQQHRLSGSRSSCREFGSRSRSPQAGSVSRSHQVAPSPSKTRLQDRLGASQDYRPYPPSATEVNVGTIKEYIDSESGIIEIESSGAGYSTVLFHVDQVFNFNTQRTYEGISGSSQVQQFSDCDVSVPLATALPPGTEVKLESRRVKSKLVRLQAILVLPLHSLSSLHAQAPNTEKLDIHLAMFNRECKIDRLVPVTVTTENGWSAIVAEIVNEEWGVLEVTCPPGEEGPDKILTRFCCFHKSSLYSAEKDKVEELKSPVAMLGLLEPGQAVSLAARTLVGQRAGGRQLHLQAVAVGLDPAGLPATALGTRLPTGQRYLFKKGLKFSLNRKLASFIKVYSQRKTSETKPKKSFDCNHNSTTRIESTRLEDKMSNVCGVVEESPGEEAPGLLQFSDHRCLFLASDCVRSGDRDPVQLYKPGAAVRVNCNLVSPGLPVPFIASSVWPADIADIVLPNNVDKEMVTGEKLKKLNDYNIQFAARFHYEKTEVKTRESFDQSIQSPSQELKNSCEEPTVDVDNRKTGDKTVNVRSIVNQKGIVKAVRKDWKEGLVEFIEDCNMFKPSYCFFNISDLYPSPGGGSAGVGQEKLSSLLRVGESVVMHGWEVCPGTSLPWLATAVWRPGLLPQPAPVPFSSITQQKLAVFRTVATNEALGLPPHSKSMLSTIEKEKHYNEDERNQFIVNSEIITNYCGLDRKLKLKRTEEIDVKYGELLGINDNNSGLIRKKDETEEKTDPSPRSLLERQKLFEFVAELLIKNLNARIEKKIG